MPNNLGEYVRKMRGDKSLRDFARQCGLSHTHIDSIEKGFDPRTSRPVNISLDVLSKIANGTGSDINYLSSLAAIDVGALPVDHSSSPPNGLNDDFFRLMKSAQDKGYSVDDVEMAFDFIDRARKRNG